MKNKNYFFLSIGNFIFDILMSKRMYQLETVSRFLDLRNKKKCFHWKHFHGALIQHAVFMRLNYVSIRNNQICSSPSFL